MIEYSKDIEAGYNILDLYYLQGIRNNEEDKKKYNGSKLEEKLLILEAYLNKIDIEEDFQEQHIFLFLSSYSEAMQYLEVSDIDNKLKESYEFYGDFYCVLDLLIIDKWRKIKENLCKNIA